MRVLFVKHDHASPSGLIGDAFTAAGWDVTEMLVVPRQRYRSPDVTAVFPAAGEFDALVPFGAPWSVYDTAAIGTWVGDEIAFVRSAIAQGIPMLGICFGGQLLAAAIGGRVSPAPVPEIGWITVSGDRSGLIQAGPWFSWHFDRFSLPAGVPVLARTAVAGQAFRAGRSLGLQFHPEVTTEVLESWLYAGGYDQLSGLPVDAEALLAQTRLLADGAAARAHRLVSRFLTDVAPRPAGPATRSLPDSTPNKGPAARGMRRVLTPAR